MLRTERVDQDLKRAVVEHSPHPRGGAQCLAHYFTVVIDLDRSRVLLAAEHRTTQSLE